MSVWDITFESAEQRFGDAQIQLFRIDSLKEHRLENAETSPQRHIHQFYELHVLSGGGHRYSIDGRNVTVGAGEAILIRPGQPHLSIVPRKDVSFSVLGLSVTQVDDNGHFYRVLMDSLDRAAGKPLPLPAPLADKISRYSHNAPAASVRQYCRRQLRACEIIVNLLEAVFEEDSPYVSTEGTDLAIMLDTFIGNRHITLQEMADRLNYSPRHLARIIKKRYGKTLRELRGANKP